MRAELPAVVTMVKVRSLLASFWSRNELLALTQNPAMSWTAASWLAHDGWNQNSTDLRYDYDRYQVMAGVKWEM